MSIDTFQFYALVASATNYVHLLDRKKIRFGRMVQFIL